MLRRFLPMLLMAGFAALAQTYDGPRPSKKDLPYLKHAENLIPTESVVAKEDESRGGITYIIPGAGSPVATPLASPVFLLQAEKVVPEDLELYKLESKNGNRQIYFPRNTRRSPPAIRLQVARIASDNLWKVEVDESLDTGEYSLTLRNDPTNRAYCFQVR